jgi:hypothetical protein
MMQFILVRWFYCGSYYAFRCEDSHHVVNPGTNNIRLHSVTDHTSRKLACVGVLL